MSIVYYFVKFFSLADANVKSALIASLVALITLVLTFIKERSKARQEAHRDKKVEAYSEFFEMISNVQRNSKTNTVDEYLESGDFLDAMYKLRKNVLFYGSPQVITALGDWSKQSATASSESQDVFHAIRPVGRLILAMRKDIGLSNFGLNEISIHQINVTDDLSQMAQTR